MLKCLHTRRYSSTHLSEQNRSDEKIQKNEKFEVGKKIFNSPSLRSHWEAIYSSVVFFRYFWMHLKVLHSVVVSFTSVQNILNFTMFWHLKRQSSYVDENSSSTNDPKPITICARTQHHVNTRTHTYTRKYSVRPKSWGRYNANNSSEIRLKLKSRSPITSIVDESFLNSAQSTTVWLCAKFRRDSSTKMNVICSRDFARFQSKKDFRRITYCYEPRGHKLKCEFRGNLSCI